MTVGRDLGTYRPKSRLLATLIGAVGISLWATETALVRFTGDIPALEIVALAFAAASLLSPLAWWLTGDSPTVALRQPWSVWAITVPSLVCYHACIYYAVHRAPAAPAALLQGCTPLFIVLGSALLPGKRIRWWHIAGVVAGLEGLIGLIAEGKGPGAISGDATLFLALIGMAAGLWGIYSLVSSRFGSVPTSAMGVFYASSSAVALLGHGLLETWVTPTLPQGLAIAGLGLLPMGLALYCWDFGLKKGDVQALGVASYVEPLIGAGLVVALGQDDLHWSMLVSGIVIIGGAVLGSANFLEDTATEANELQARDEIVKLDRQHATDREILALVPPALRKIIQNVAVEHGVSIDVFVRQCIEHALRGEADKSPIAEATVTGRDELKAREIADGDLLETIEMIEMIVNILQRLGKGDIDRHLSKGRVAIPTRRTA